MARKRNAGAARSRKPAIKIKAKSSNGHGGHRSGAGRPKNERGPGGISWLKVRDYARLGADRDTILSAFGAEPSLLQDPEFVGRLQREMERGGALLQIDILRARRKLGREGKVSAVLAGLRQKLGWDRPDSGKSRSGQRPDTEAAVAELDKLLQRVR